MRSSDDQLAALLSPEMIRYAERINMPYLGYHLLRERLTTKLLGESESPILYWIGKDIGKHIPIDSADGLVLPFIRLGLGQLDVLERTENRYVFRLFHSIYDVMTMERLGSTLSFECGVIAGAISCWRNHPAHAQMELFPGASGRPTEAHIIVTM